MKFNIRQILPTLLIIVVIFLGLHFSLQSYTVSGASMEPSFVNGEWLLVDKLTYHFTSPSRGDVVILQPPVNSNEPYIKRVIGLPGDHIEITEDGAIYINDSLLEENPDMGPTYQTGNYSNVYLEEDEYFVLGDNRLNSKDSRSFGPITGESIIGKTWIRYWPPSELGLSPSYSAELN